jgi:hypothetical protein
MTSYYESYYESFSFYPMSNILKILKREAARALLVSASIQKTRNPSLPVFDTTSGSATVSSRYEGMFDKKIKEPVQPNHTYVKYDS